MARTPAPESRIPLKELELLILLSVEQEPLHGYALLDRVSERSDGFIKPGPASLYRTIAALFDEGLLEEVQTTLPAELDDARRRYFGPTTFGRAVLRAELRRLSVLLAQARALGIRYGASNP
jgi:DNA-binding PadR family transcriptional regulator